MNRQTSREELAMAQATSAALPNTDPMAREVTLTRVLDAPRSLVWSAWTDPEHMAQWWGPHHFTNPLCRMDVKQGGQWLMLV
jgi:uncharacterized protein YndB with AHSA1/START domain